MSSVIDTLGQPTAPPILRCLAPLAGPGARALVLGSMPGEASLRAGRYYAHPRNAFWPIMGELLGAGPELPYDARVARLLAAGIAVWDVLAACTRAGSLDTAIPPASMRPNDFADFFARHPAITQVFFNGSLAENSFRRLVLPGLLPVLLAGPAPRRLHYARLPSTSPAHAALSPGQKAALWAEKWRAGGLLPADAALQQAPLHTV